jgi:hypothetical protein
MTKLKGLNIKTKETNMKKVLSDLYGAVVSTTTLQKILAGNQPESGRVVPGSPAGKIIYWSPEFCQRMS